MYEAPSISVQNAKLFTKHAWKLETLLTFTSGLVNFTWKWIKCDREVQPAECMHVSLCLVNSPNVVCRLNNALNYIFQSGNYSDVDVVVILLPILNVEAVDDALWYIKRIFTMLDSVKVPCEFNWLYRPIHDHSIWKKTCINLWPGSARNANCFHTNSVVT